jgi:hypothetical protein
VRTNYRGFILFLCVILIFITEVTALGEYRLHGILIIFLCDCDIYL